MDFDNLHVHVYISSGQLVVSESDGELFIHSFEFNYILPWVAIAKFYVLMYLMYYRARKFSCLKNFVVKANYKIVTRNVFKS